jgi:hypothetical protein
MKRIGHWSLVAAAALAAVSCGQARAPSQSDGAPSLSDGAPSPSAGAAKGATCPAIACAGGARLRFDFPFSFVEARDATFEACRNDLCYSAMLEDAEVEPPAGSAVGFRAPPVGTPSDDDFVEVTLMNDADGRGLSLQMWWWPYDTRTQRDSDRYKFNMTVGGVRTVFLDEVAKYTDASLGTPGDLCFQKCSVFNEDRRGQRLPGGS